MEWAHFESKLHTYTFSEIDSKPERYSILNITANAHQALLDQWAVCAVRKKPKLSSDGEDSGSKKCK
jgi:hypothetical protein